MLVLGAGVAGLQAIGTAKRLGARVSANDIRPASADEVASMGGTFIKLDLETAEASGGYARELSADRGALQRALLAPHVAQADVLITTAAVPGRRAPLLVSREMVQRMRAGLGGRRPRRRVGRQCGGQASRARIFPSRRRTAKARSRWWG